MKVTVIGQIYILLTLKRTLKFAVTEKHLEILLLSTSIFYLLDRLLSFDSPHFGFLFRGSIFNLQKYVSVESASGRAFKCHYLHLG